MDYYLTLTESDSSFVLHKITCQKLQQSKSTAYVGYFWGVHAAIQQAVVIAKGPVVLCSLCLSQDDKKP
ncbi:MULTISPECIES: hypothetical protein [Morganella]|uniref:hypothetical protein n=1 Tax=Morganella TaxID=581 RepID=UPI001419D9C4|nr:MULTISPECIES: hypothetical protein [Morganella]NIH18456.1 hypothetical protein [Morganella morganii]QXO66856.1 hypothetical protein JC825_08045 [Morganella morganii]